MSPWMRRVFIETLPRIIRVQRPRQYAPKVELKSRVDKEREKFLKRSEYSSATAESDELSMASFSYNDEPAQEPGEFHLENAYAPEVQRAIEAVKYIADRYRDNKEQENSIQDWKYVARVIDRLFLWVFGIGVIIGTFVVILQAPSLYDTRTPIPEKCESNATGAEAPETKNPFICSLLL